MPPPLCRPVRAAGATRSFDDKALLPLLQSSGNTRFAAVINARPLPPPSARASWTASPPPSPPSPQPRSPQSSHRHRRQYLTQIHRRRMRWPPNLRRHHRGLTSRRHHISGGANTGNTGGVRRLSDRVLLLFLLVLLVSTPDVTNNIHGPTA